MKEIAFTLSPSVEDPRDHRAQLMERLNIHDVAGLVRVGLVDPGR